MNDHTSVAMRRKTEAEHLSVSEGLLSAIDSRDDQLSITQLWRVLQKRRWLIFSSLIVVISVVTVISLLLPKRYDASATILLDLEGSNDFSLEDSTMPMSIDLDTKLQTQISIVQSDTIATGVIEQLALHHNKTFAGELASRSGQDFESLDFRTCANLIAFFHNSLTVRLIPKTEIIEIHFRSKDPALAADIVNSIASTYIEHNFQTKYRATIQTADWLTKELGDLKKHGEAAEEALITYQKKTGILGVDEVHNIITDKLEELNKAVSLAEGDRILKEARYRIAMSENPELIAEIAPGSLLGTLYKERAEARAQYAQMAAKYGASYPRVVQLQSQLEELNSSISDEVKKVGETVHAEYKTALKAEQMLQQTFNTQKEEAFKLNQDAIQYAILRRDVESSRDLYEGLLKKLKEAGILAGLKSSNINVVDHANVPLSPVEPRIALNILLGCMGGLLFGVAMAFVVDNVDHSIRTPEDVETYCELPSLGIIPRVPSTRNSARHGRESGKHQFIAPVTMEHRNSGNSEAFRALRTSLLLSSPGSPPQVMLVTSATMQEGKSFTALNLAVVLAQTGQQVLLVDSDMRRPAVHKYLGIAMNRGLSACLAGTEDPDAVVIKIDEIPGLHIVTAGHMPPYPSEMLASEAMPQLVQHWRKKFRYIIIDTPPVLAVTDAVVCASAADVVVLIARSEKTRRQSLTRACDLLKRVRANIAGVVVNDLSLNSTDYRQYYGYYGTDYQGYYHQGNGNAGGHANGNGSGNGNGKH